MILLDISGWNLFTDHAAWTQFAFLILKLLTGTLLLLVFSIACLVLIGLNTVYQLVNRQSLAYIGRALVRKVALLGGAIAAFSFALLATMVFQLSFWVVLIVSGAILYATQYLFRKAIFFLLVKRFGRYILYLRSLRLIGQKFAYVFRR